MPRELQRLLGLMHRGPGRNDGAVRSRRDALLAQMEPSAGGAPAWFRSWPAMASAVALFFAVVVGACAVPVDYTVGMGARIGIVLDPDQLEDADPETIGRYLEERYTVENMAMRVRHEMGADGSGKVHIQMDMFGPGIEADAVWADLEDAFPALVGTRGPDMPFEAIVQGTLGGRLAHEYLDVVIDRDGIEAARQRILDDLAAQGLEGTAEIHVEDGPGRREVRVEVQAHSPRP